MYNIKRQVFYMIRSIIPIKYRVIMDYKKVKGELPNLKDPTTFSEKMQWIKIYGNLPKYQNLVDKYEVRKYIESNIGKKYLINLIDKFESVDEIDFDKLPKSFVLKLNYGSGYNIIIKDKDKVNIEEVKNKLNNWLSQKFYLITNELQYKNIPPKILCEEYMEDESGSLRDYKILCFDGEPKIIQVDSDRFKNHTRSLYDIEWNKLNFKRGNIEMSNIDINKPEKLKEMLDLARKLSKNIPFVRVDFYYIDNKIYFGELTFTPASGRGQFTPIEMDKKIASMIDLRGYM